MKNRALISKNLKEILRDPLSYIFCLGFPVVMLIIMTIVNGSIPKEANMTIFNIDKLSAGVTVFGYTFLMLFSALQLSKDMSGALLTRLYASPLKPVNYMIGYCVPVIIFGIFQSVITFAVSFVISVYSSNTLSLTGMAVAVAVLLPTQIMFVGIGLLFGSLLSDKSAPGLCSIVISAASLLGGIWMDVDKLGGTFLKVCKAFPFYHSVKTGVYSISGDYGKIIPHLVFVVICTIAVYAAASIVFKGKMRKDK